MSDFDAELAIEAMLNPAHPRKLAAAAFARENLPGEAPGLPETEPDLHRTDTGFNRAGWKLAADFGAIGLKTPIRYGGSDVSTIEALLTFEGLGLGCSDNGFVFALASQVFAMQTALVGAGSEAQKEEWLPAMCAGEAIGSFAMSEPEAGSDTASITTTAGALERGGYRLDGEKCWVTLGPVCDVIIVFATTNPELGRWGITAFLVPTDTVGVHVGETVSKAGLHGSPFGTITFDGCIVGDDAVLGTRGAGGSIFSAAVEAERAFLYAAELGAMERTLDATVARARKRNQFGQSIGSFQAVSHRIADMVLRLESARLLVYKAAALHDRGDSVTMAAALAKLQTSEAGVTSALDAIRIHGAEGYTTALGIESELRDAVGGLAYSGTSEIQKNVIARLLGLGRNEK